MNLPDMRVATAVDVHAFAPVERQPAAVSAAASGAGSAADSVTGVTDEAAAANSAASAANNGASAANNGASAASSAGHRSLMLACLEWPGERPLAGHSDGDAAAHAVCDALLIASGVGEMGSIFGTSRPEFAGAAGETFLRETVRLVREAGYGVTNVSVQIVAQRPRFAPRKEQAQARMSEIVGAPVSVAATTTDHLGVIGAGEGVAAIATALLHRLA